MLLEFLMLLPRCFAVLALARQSPTKNQYTGGTPEDRPEAIMPLEYFKLLRWFAVLVLARQSPTQSQYKGGTQEDIPEASHHTIECSLPMGLASSCGLRTLISCEVILSKSFMLTKCF